MVRENKNRKDKESMKKVTALICFIMLTGAVVAAEETPAKEATEKKGPPLPTHCIHGYSGIFITPTAYMANPAKPGEFWGKPSVSATYGLLRHKNYQSFAVTQNILGTIELGYAMERIGLGDWPSEVKQATGNTIDKYGIVHNFNIRTMLIQEGGMDCDWMPALTTGAHFKWNDSLSDLDSQMGGACSALGADHDFGTEFTLTASKTFTDLLPRPLIVSAGLRNSDAIHTGLFGFAGERKTTIEGNIVYFLTDRLLLATEYRQKSNLMSECTVGGKDLVKAENDWWDVCLAYIIDDRTTLAGGYANFGNVLNNREDNVWAFQLKHEF
jgi:hypothetical protein